MKSTGKHPTRSSQSTGERRSSRRKSEDSISSGGESTGSRYCRHGRERSLSGSRPRGSSVASSRPSSHSSRSSYDSDANESVLTNGADDEQYWEEQQEQERQKQLIDTKSESIKESNANSDYNRFRNNLYDKEAQDSWSTSIAERLSSKKSAGLQNNGKEIVPEVCHNLYSTSIIIIML